MVKALENSANMVFYENSIAIKVNKAACTEYASSQKIETLIKELKEKGPLMGTGMIGPGSYRVEPFKLRDQVHGYEVYGWKPGAERHANRGPASLVIIGAKKVEEGGYVYFALASLVDKRVYVVSHKTFNAYLVDLYPPYASTPEGQYLEQLSKIMPIESILGANEAACRAIGQQIFDFAKKNAHGDTYAGFIAVQKICDEIANYASDGRLRKQFIERAWNGIGDSRWQWIA